MCYKVYTLERERERERERVMLFTNYAFYVYAFLHSL